MLRFPYREMRYRKSNHHTWNTRREHSPYLKAWRFELCKIKIFAENYTFEAWFIQNLIPIFYPSAIIVMAVAPLGLTIFPPNLKLFGAKKILSSQHWRETLLASRNLVPLGTRLGWVWWTFFRMRSFYIAFHQQTLGKS